jgi:signal transduction histidine kinase
VTRQVVAPVRRASEVAQRLSAGKLNERMPSRGEDDLALLATSFNAMADSLQSQIRQLEGLSAVQQRFVSDVSHELRTPLTTIRMAVDVIHDSRTGFDPSVARSAELLAGELDRFEELLADLLEISRFDAGAAALDVETVDLRSPLRRVVEATRPLADRRGSVVTLHLPDEPAEAEVDERRVERILRNLVVNAIEHGEGRPVDIHVGVGSDAVAVVVEDHGVGLRPGEAANVFTRFWRADPARARTTGGTGLGLSISLEDARLHNGWLQAWGERGGRLAVPPDPAAAGRGDPARVAAGPQPERGVMSRVPAGGARAARRVRGARRLWWAVARRARRAGARGRQRSPRRPAGDLPRAPAPGESQESIVRGFVRAGAASDAAYDNARAFLTAPVSEAWNPDVSLVLLAEAAPPATVLVNPATVRITAKVAATVDEEGRHTAAARAAP